MLGRGLFSLIGIAIMVAFTGSSVAQGARPCGPEAMRGPLRFLIPQGVAGADFRPACRRHDACYDTLGVNRAACDRRYHRAMQCACDQSRHPLFCRFVARVMYKVTSRRGTRAFVRAQSLAAAALRMP